MNLKLHMSELKTVMGILHGSRAFGGPLQADFGLTNKCNAQCIHCYYYSPLLEKPTLRPLRKARKMATEPPSLEVLRSMQRRDADTEHTNRLIDELIAMGTRRFRFGGAGEPFVHKNALDFMDRVKHSGSTCIVSTGGHMFDRDKIDVLLKMGFDEMRITTMAGSPEMYKRTHPKAKDTAFDNLRDNLLYLAERKEAMGVSRPEVRLYSVIISENFDSPMDFAKFAVHVKADWVQYRPYDDVGDPGLAVLVPSAEQASFVKKQLNEIKPYLEDHGIKHNIDRFLKVFDKQLDTAALYRIIPCYYGWAVMQILASGKVFPCGRCYDSFGDAYKTELNKIWNGETYREFRKEAKTLNKRNTTVSGCDCNSCSHHTANLRIYRALHPIKKRSKRLQRLSPIGPI
jgi:MoaA/NifB/PqqE/SkfB family radical SAM enzyme